MSSAFYYQIRCSCGHQGHVAFTRWLHRDEVLRRTRCSTCGAKDGRDIRLVPGPDAGLSVCPDIRPDLSVHDV